jgi:SAM-dependent methyltransferase
MGTPVNPAVIGIADGRYGTRPGTPMIGPYSVNQMDDFYTALAHGQVKLTGVMNYIQRLFIAERCAPGAAVVDVCCGRGLQLPALWHYAPHIERYVGLDIAPANLDEARQRIEDLERRFDRGFSIELVQCDVAEKWPDLPSFDVAIYTSALEHLPREQAIASLRNTLAALRPGGVLFLSTPNTPGTAPSTLQHRVHVYEWNCLELVRVLKDCGFTIQEMVGLLPPAVANLADLISRKYGPGAVRWHDRMRFLLPEAFLGPIMASAFPEDAAEVMYICTRNGGDGHVGDGRRG